MKSEPCAQVPEAPVALRGLAKEYWDRHAPQLVASNILTPLLVDSFAICCQLYAEHQYWQAWLEEDPCRCFYTTESGYQQVSPQVVMRQRAFSGWCHLASKFGLTADALAKMRKHGGISGAVARKLPPALEFAASKGGQREDL